jgi:hypothetical protein
MRLLPGVRYASLLAYSPHASDELAVRSRGVCSALKGGHALGTRPRRGRHLRASTPQPPPIPALARPRLGRAPEAESGPCRSMPRAGPAVLRIPGEDRWEPRR